MKRKLAPAPSALFSAQSRPLWASTMVREIDSPMPIPSGLVLTNGSKMRSMSPGGMPRPVSLTQTSATWPGVRDAVTPDRPAVAGNRVEGVHAVDDQVQQDLLELHPVAENLGQATADVDVEPDAAGGGIGSQQRHDVEKHVLQVERHHLDRLSPEQGAHPVDHVAGTAIVLADVVDDRADLVEVGRGMLDEERRRLGIAQDGAERLIDLVRERGGELAHDRDAPDVGDVLAQAQHFLARPAFAR